MRIAEDLYNEVLRGEYAGGVPTPQIVSSGAPAEGSSDPSAAKGGPVDDGGVSLAAADADVATSAKRVRLKGRRVNEVASALMAAEAARVLRDAALLRPLCTAVRWAWENTPRNVTVGIVRYWGDRPEDTAAHLEVAYACTRLSRQNDGLRAASVAMFFDNVRALSSKFARRLSPAVASTSLHRNCLSCSAGALVHVQQCSIVLCLPSYQLLKRDFVSCSASSWRTPRVRAACWTWAPLDQSVARAFPNRRSCTSPRRSATRARSRACAARSTRRAATSRR